MTLGAANNIALVSPDVTFDDLFDKNNPDYVNDVFGNIGTNDCVIAARAHHTIRLDYDPATPILVIATAEVIEEFLGQSQGSDTGGINPFDSLSNWKDPGWIAGAAMGFTQKRKIDDFGFVDVPGIGDGSGTPMPESAIDLVKTAIVSHSGAHFTLNLPGGIGPPNNKSFGWNNPWTDLNAGSAANSHTMLLTGYDTLGPVGITWGQRQRMSWDFLYTYGASLFWVRKGAST
jgi:hypothetical protein